VLRALCKHQLIPIYQPAGGDGCVSARRKNSTVAGARTSKVTQGRILTQHTGLPPRVTGSQPTPTAAPRAATRRKPR